MFYIISMTKYRENITSVRCSNNSKIGAIKFDEIELMILMLSLKYEIAHTVIRRGGRVEMILKAR